MKRFLLLAFLFFGLAIFFYVYGALVGEVQTGLFLIFPYIVGNGIYPLLGTIFLMLAIFAFFLALIKRTINSRFESEIETQISKPVKTTVDGIVLIGPFPVIFSTEKSRIPYLLGIAIVLIIFFILVLAVSYYGLLR
ncbi:MAG: DUF131 domain-containing protein [Thermoplasmata archaeon]